MKMATKKSYPIRIVIVVILALVIGMAMIPKTVIAETTEYKETVLWATSGDPNYVDPHMNNSNSVIVPNVFDSLLDADDEGNFTGALATEWWCDEDDVTWHFILREGVKFHDGSDMTMDDVVASFDRLTDKENPTKYTNSFAYIKEYYAASDSEFVIVTNEPVGNFERDIAFRGGMIMDDAYIAAYGMDCGTSPETTNGTGIYKLTDWVHSESFTFTAFRDCWRGSDQLTENIKFVVMSDQTARGVAIESGDVDIASGLSPEDVILFKTGDRVSIFETPGNGWRYFQFICSDGSNCKNLNVRLAILHAVDTKTIVEAVYAESGDVLMNSVVNGYYEGYKDLGLFEYNPELAKEYLTKAGYANGLDIKCMVTASYNKCIDVAQIMQQMLAQVGINMEIITIENATFKDCLSGLTAAEFDERYGYDMTIMGGGGGGSTSFFLNYQYLSSDDNSCNHSFYKNDEVDNLILTASVTVDGDARREMFSRVYEILYRDDPSGIYMNIPANTLGLNPAMVGFNCNYSGTTNWAQFGVAMN